MVRGALSVDHVLGTGEARESLPAILDEFRKSGANARPFVVGAHRRPEGVLISYSLYRQLLENLDELAIRSEVEQRLSEGGREVDLSDAIREFGVTPRS